MKPESNRIIGVGDTLILFMENKDDVTCEVVDSGVYMADNGQWDFGFHLKWNDDEDSNWTPFSVLSQLFKDGELFLEKHAKVAQKIREIRKKTPA